MIFDMSRNHFISLTMDIAYTSNNTSLSVGVSSGMGMSSVARARKLEESGAGS